MRFDTLIPPSMSSSTEPGFDSAKYSIEKTQGVIELAEQVAAGMTQRRADRLVLQQEALPEPLREPAAERLRHFREAGDATDSIISQTAESAGERVIVPRVERRGPAAVQEDEHEWLGERRWPVLADV